MGKTAGGRLFCIDSGFTKANDFMDDHCRSSYPSECVFGVQSGSEKITKSNDDDGRCLLALTVCSACGSFSYADGAMEGVRIYLVLNFAAM